jgi:hypothetical protein
MGSSWLRITASELAYLIIQTVKQTDKYEVKIKATPVTGRGGPQGCETSRLPHFLESRQSAHK